MILKTTFSKFFSFLTMATLLVACSQNDDNATTTNNVNNARANRVAQTNLPHGKLIIRNTTQHTFVDDLYVLNILRDPSVTDFYWLSQEIIINPYTDIELAKYSNTTTLGIDYDGNAEWNTIDMNGVASITSEQNADINNRSQRLYNGAPVDIYVEWNSFNATSDDGTVKFKFKVDSQTGDILVNEPYGTFTTTAYVDDFGDIIIILAE